VETKTVVITGDLIRLAKIDNLFSAGCVQNIDWLACMLEPSLRDLGCKTKKLTPLPKTEKDLWFDQASLYRHFDAAYNFDGWGRIETSGDFSFFIRFFRKVIKPDSIVVGYEMSDLMLGALASIGIPYIDIALHPVRFLHDLVFGIRTNDQWINKVALECKDPLETIPRQVASIKAKVAWMYKPRQVVGKTLLVLGQSPYDRALLTLTGRFASLRDYEYDLLKIIDDYNSVIYKPHPYDQSRELPWENLKIIQRIKVAEDNFYQLISQPGVQKVFALNSSGLTEANLFGLKIQPLISPRYAWPCSVEGSNLVKGLTPQTPSWITTPFWNRILNGASVDSSNVEFALGNNFFRKSMNADWGYGYIDQLVAQ
jgi:hypothetical protein